MIVNIQNWIAKIYKVISEKSEEELEMYVRVVYIPIKDELTEIWVPLHCLDLNGLVGTNWYIVLGSSINDHVNEDSDYEVWQEGSIITAYYDENDNLKLDKILFVP